MLVTLGLLPLTTLLIFLNSIPSPGLILSGLYPTKKSLLNSKSEYFSRTGIHSSYLNTCLNFD